MNERQEAAGAEDRGDEEMQPQAEDVMGTQLELLLLLHRDPTVGGAPNAPPGRPSSDAPTSLVMITLTGMAALASHLAAGATPDLTITAALAGSTAVGALCGTLAAQSLPQRALGRAFALVVAAVAVFLLMDTVALGGPPGR